MNVRVLFMVESQEREEILSQLLDPGRVIIFRCIRGRCRLGRVGRGAAVFWRRVFDVVAVSCIGVVGLECGERAVRLCVYKYELKLGR